MAREMYLAGVSEEELRPDPKPEKPKTFKARLQNFFYHYKWVVLTTIAVVAVLAVMIWQAVTRVEPDYTLLLVTEKHYGAEALQYFENALIACGEDVNNDGVVKVQITNCFLNSSADPRLSMVNAQMLQVHLAARDVMLFAFEPEKYVWLTALTEKNAETTAALFVPFGANAASGESVSYRLWEKSKHADAASAQLPESLYFAVRALPDDADASEKAMQENALALLAAYTAE